MRLPSVNIAHYLHSRKPPNLHISGAQCWNLARIPTSRRHYHATQPRHVRSVHENLQKHGILKIGLKFPDPDSEYLKQLVVGLHQHHGHQLPISHSASRGWFWDVRPNSTVFQTANHQARSETMEEFPWHTDCSYEDLPPRYFALHVLQEDQFGGGTLSAMNTQRLSLSLSPATRESLMRREYSITIPPEFIKDPRKQNIIGSLMAADEQGQLNMLRFRRDLVTALTERAAKALHELEAAVQDANAQFQSTVHLTAKDFPAGTIILMDNRRWLHARHSIKDPNRHLRRVRWDAIPFDARPMEQ
ncbi:hypothetical protein TRIATDRAFT_292284 [Trichoderma atroviride IMI 206040]|uniref:TauD/TfdA-like domain-containing protein n=1 Tax=Hypocrea atroviridis (strain ATCC 20476 / IMI 206040) TaxID=452589 RepID=G9NTR8_HYPAI|nr:uncharacterized protein TRIATDRAFT_292284 [Trichoderma atroviride IMI 206040]EHK46106.1 hypothetical protein TRIATDRAFT_292284 [Trichoderma atroviride IMI 206040]